jgi:hypothetical protein
LNSRPSIGRASADADCRRDDGLTGGRIYDANIAELARIIGAPVVVTDNRRHFLSALRYGMRVETPAEFLAGLKGKRS